jgi:hypothetical protein
MIEWTYDFNVLTVLKGCGEVASAKARVNTAVNKAATKARTKTLHGVS